MRKQIQHVVVLLLAGSAGLGAQTTYTGTFRSHQVSVNGVVANYTTPNATIPVTFADKGASIQGNVTLTFPAVTPPASTDPSTFDQFPALNFQPPFQATIGVSGTLTTADDKFSSEIVLMADEPLQSQACAIVYTTKPAPQGTSNLSNSSLCTLHWVSIATTTAQQFTFKTQGSVFLTRADGTGASFGFHVTTTYAIATGPATPSLDLAVDHVEVVQVVQHWNNTIPLIANKSTAARVFAIVSGNNSQPLAGISGVLHGFRNDVELPGSPLAPVKKSITVPVQFDRANASHSLNFLLPKDWTAAGSIRLVADVSAPAAVTEQNTANNILPQEVTFTTLANIPDPIYMYYLPVCYQPPGTDKQCPTADVSGADTLIPKLYPIPDNGLQYLAWQVPQKIWREPLITDVDINRMFTSLRKFYLMLDDQKGGIDQLAAWLPPIPGSWFGGLADADWGGHGGTNRVTFNSRRDRPWVLAHETGHNLGLRHTTTADGCKASDTSKSSDWTYRDATIEEIGMDPVTMEVKPATKKDVMSYCSPPISNIWISPFHYMQIMHSPVLKRASGASVAQPAADARAFPDGTALQSTAAQYLLISGSARADGTVGSLDPAYQLSSSTPGETSDPAGNHCLRFTASASSDFCFTLAFQSPESFAPIEEESFTFRVALPAGTTRIALRHLDHELASLTVSSQAPSLRILTPSAHDKWDGSRTITWSSSATNGNPLSYLVQYSADGGKSWLPMEVDLQQPQFTFDTADIQAGPNTYFRVLATNGVRTASAVVGPIGIAASPRIEALPSLDFGAVKPGQSADQTLWLRNRGNGPLTVHSLGIDNPAFASISPAAPYTLAAGGRHQVTVRFRPAAAGRQTGTLTIASDDPSNAVTKVALTGGLNTSSPAVAISVTPTSLAFGSVSAGQTKDLSLTVSNKGTAALSVKSLSIGKGTFSVVSPSTPFNVAGASQQTLKVSFSPKAAGSQSGTLAIASNDPSNPTVSVTLAGQGTGAAPPAATVKFSDSFNRAAAGSCSLGHADLALGGSGAYYYLPVFSGANIVSGTLQNKGTGNGGIQVTDSPNTCNNGARGMNIGQDFNIQVDLLVPSDPAGDMSTAGPYFRNRASAANDGILGGDSAGYWIQLVSTGEVKVRDCHTALFVASSAKPATFDHTVFHTLEVAARGGQLQVALDGQLMTFTQGSTSATTVVIPDTGGSNDGTAGIAFGRENAWPAIGGQSARNLMVTAFRSLATPSPAARFSEGDDTNAASNELTKFLDGVSVQPNEENAAMSFIRPSQVNAAAPAGIPPAR